MSRKLTISLCVLAYLTIAIVFFILFSGCAGQSGWHIALECKQGSVWHEAYQEPKIVIIKCGGVIVKTNCEWNAFYQHRALAGNKDIEECHYIIYRIENWKPYKVVAVGNYYEVLRWFEER